MRTGPVIDEGGWINAVMPLRTVSRTGSIRLAVLVLGIDADTDAAVPLGGDMTAVTGPVITAVSATAAAQTAASTGRVRERGGENNRWRYQERSWPRP